MVFAVFYALFVLAALALVSVPVLLFSLVILSCSTHESLAIALTVVAVAYCCTKRGK